ncbi:hypothetical protein FGB62_74g120 [Gracilaria domingensis]|nr:hypothetical protein FGB62_74g120 [Gracilaria domingensis]
MPALREQDARGIGLTITAAHICFVRYSSSTSRAVASAPAIHSAALVLAARAPDSLKHQPDVPGAAVARAVVRIARLPVLVAHHVARPHAVVHVQRRRAEHAAQPGAGALALHLKAL